MSAIDWHIEFGEIKDTLEEIRSDYRNAYGDRISNRPYVFSLAEGAAGKIDSKFLIED